MVTARAILALETSHEQGSVAVGARELPLVVEFSPGLVHARELQVRIDEALVRAGLERAELGLIAVSAGPGSYTGVRIGVAAAKAMAWGLGIPVLGVSTLEVIAANVTEPGPFAVLLDARRASCYGAHFECREDSSGRTTTVRLGPDRVCGPAAFLAELPAGRPLVGEGARSVPGTETFPRLAEEWGVAHARQVHALARVWWYEIIQGKRTAPEEFTDPHRLVPRYLRPSQAEERAQAEEQARAARRI